MYIGDVICIIIYRGIELITKVPHK